MTLRRALLAVAVAAALLPALARADADPPSDVLPAAQVYYPYTPQVSRPLRTALIETLARAGRAGMKLKVALIATRVDLGAVATLFGQTQRYADFLEQEIAFGRPSPLLVVMPQGLAAAAVPAPAKAAAATVKVPAPGDSDALARAAVAGVAAIAKAQGKPIETPALPAPATGGGGGKGGGGGGIPAGLLIGIGALLLLLAAGIAIAAIRLRGEQEDGKDAEG